MIVTRFAPSPTGYLHVGGARTALFNWLLARKNGGKFLLRIEDTDVKRNTPTAEQQVINDLRWLGIDWDYGPEVGGPDGPYRQSQRRDIYDKYMKQLLDAGQAYYCFDTPEEIQEYRKAAEKAKKTFIYPRPKNFPTAADVENARNQKRPITLRFAITETEPIIIKDIVRGEVTFNPSEFSDFIIQKSDGFPTYHMAVIIDDELMNVTHVCRGQEHLMNTPCHQMLQKALGFRTPTYAHMSVTVSESGGKLSKRERPKALRTAIKATADVDVEKLAQVGNISSDDMQKFLKNKSVPDIPAIDAIAEYMELHLPEINVVDFFKSGYLRETMINFLALLGWNPGNDKEVMTLEELIECFDEKRLSKANSLFDRKKLLSFNTEHIRMISKDKLLAHFEHYLKAVDSVLLKGDDETLLELLEVNQGARTLEQIESKCRFLFIDDDAIDYNEKDVKKILLKNNGAGLKMLSELKAIFQSNPSMDEQQLEDMLRGLAHQKEVGLGKVAQPLRVAICGNTVSPPIFFSIEKLTMEKTLKRMDIAIEKFSN